MKRGRVICTCCWRDNAVEAALFDPCWIWGPMDSGQRKRFRCPAFFCPLFSMSASKGKICAVDGERVRKHHRQNGVDDSVQKTTEILGPRGSWVPSGAPVSEKFAMDRSATSIADGAMPCAHSVKDSPVSVRQLRGCSSTAADGGPSEAGSSTC